jgi:hypothetical protein
MNIITQVLILSGILVSVSMAMHSYRMWRLYHRGPTQREFTRAVSVIHEFINHHNRTHKGRIISLTISDSDIAAEIRGGHTKDCTPQNCDV